MTYKIAILGASGYTGAELVRLIASHPSMEVVALSGNSKAGMSMAQVFPHLRHLDLPVLTTIDEMSFDGIDLAFCALPHKTSQKVISKLPKTLRIVDLSADFRLRDPAEYEKWYGNSHSAVELQKEAVYGLTEFYRDDIANARLVAGTGCNAATGQFALRPLIAAGVIDLDDIILDLACAVSGAGRSLKENLLHAELSEGAHAYAVGGTHRHLGEFDQEFSAIAWQYLRGDVNCDGLMNVIDALFIAQVSVSNRFDTERCPLANALTEAHDAPGDLNLDGVSDIIDALLIAQCSVDIRDSGFCPDP